MTAHLTEEEQLQALKRWWDENGKSTAIGIVLAVAGYFGWEGWQAQQQQTSEQASAIYESLMDATRISGGEDLSEDQLATAGHLIGQLKADYSSTLYASQAAFFEARLAVEKGDYDAAATALDWVVERKLDEPVHSLALSRLARVEWSRGNHDAALALVGAPGEDSFASSFAELRGDILLDQGKTSEARAAYQSALTQITPEQESRRALLDIKLNDLQEAIAVPTSSAQDSVSAAQETETSVEAPAEVSEEGLSQ